MSAVRVAALVALIAAAGCVARDTGKVAIGEPLPPYATTDLAGDSVSLARERGQVVLLNLWATWCHPCRDEVPVLEALHQRFGAQGLRVLGVSVDAAGDEAAIRDFARRYRMTYPIWRDPGERISQLYFSLGVPTTFLVARNGVLLWRHSGPIRASDTVLVATIERALADTTSR